MSSALITKCKQFSPINRMPESISINFDPNVKHKPTRHDSIQKIFKSSFNSLQTLTPLTVKMIVV